MFLLFFRITDASLPLTIVRLGLIDGQEQAQVCPNFHLMSVKHFQMRKWTRKYVISAIYCFWLEYSWVSIQVYWVHFGGFPSYWSRGSLPVLLRPVSRHSRYSCSGRHWNCWPASATTAGKMAQETGQARSRERTTTSFSQEAEGEFKDLLLLPMIQQFFLFPNQ